MSKNRSVNKTNYTNNIGITVVLKISKANIVSQDVINALMVLEEVLWEADKELLHSAIDIMNLDPQIAKVVRKKTIRKLDLHKNKRIKFTSARNGSILIEGAVAAFGYFILKNTIGELFKDTVQGSQIYKKLNEYYIECINDRTSAIVQKLTKKLKKRKLKGKLRPKEENNNNHIIEFDFFGNKKEDGEGYNTWEDLLNDEFSEGEDQSESSDS